MPLYESQAELWIVSFILMALIYPIWYISLIVFADKDKQVDPLEIAKQENPYS